MVLTSAGDRAVLRTGRTNASAPRAGNLDRKEAGSPGRGRCRGARATCVLEEIPMAAVVMARLHALNLATWKTDPFMLETHGLRALEDLAGELQAIAARSDLPEGRCVMAQVCVERI